MCIWKIWYNSLRRWKLFLKIVCEEEYNSFDALQWVEQCLRHSKERLCCSFDLFSIINSVASGKSRNYEYILQLRIYKEQLHSTFNLKYLTMICKHISWDPNKLFNIFTVNDKITLYYPM